MTLLVSSAFAQRFSFTNTKPDLSAFAYTNQIGLKTKSSIPLRNTPLMYTDFRLDDVQVISIHQPQTQMDFVYYVDNSGKVKYRTVSSTGMLNSGIGMRTQYDSFNPYGSRTMEQGIVTGLINVLLQSRGSRLLQLK